MLRNVTGGMLQTPCGSKSPLIENGLKLTIYNLKFVDSTPQAPILYKPLKREIETTRSINRWRGVRYEGADEVSA